MLRVTVDQVQQRKQVNPHNVDKVPVETADFQRGVIFRSKVPLPGHDQKPGKNAEPHDHVQRVKPGHDEVESKENLRMAGVGILIGVSRHRDMLEAEGCAGYVVLVELIFVLDAFDPKEGETEQHGEREHAEHYGAAGGLRRPDGENDSQAAADQHGGVGGAESSIDRFAGSSEIRKVPEAVNEV